LELFGRVGEMFAWFAAPLAVIFALATLTVPPDSSSSKDSSKKDKSEQSDKSSSKGKSEETDQSSSENDKSGKANKSASAMISKGKRHSRTKHQE
jgi:hypothetical protein